MEQRKATVVFGLALVLGLAAVTFFMVDQLRTTNAAGGGPEMRLTIKDPGDACVDNECTVAQGAAFTLAVELVAIPANGYAVGQTFVVFGSDLVYKPTETAPEEFVWPDCEPQVALRGIVEGGTAVAHGCLTSLLPPLPGSNYVGNFLELSFNCSEGDSTTQVDLVPFGEDPAGPNGAQLVDPDGQTAFTPKVNSLTITCGSGGTEPTATQPVVATPTTGGPTNTPMATATTGPTNTPTATATTGPTNTPTNTPPPSTRDCGDVNDDGSVTSVDALWVLWYVANLVDSIDTDYADVNGDGDVSSIDASLILQNVADLLSSLSC